MIILGGIIAASFLTGLGFILGFIEGSEFTRNELTK